MNSEVSLHYSQLINMPQMAVAGLSESWLMKEIGNCHWQMLCDDLGLKSNEIKDEFGNRLYPTFIRIIIRGNRSLRHYKENDVLDISGTIQQVSSMLFCSTINVQCKDRSFRCLLTTSFTTRENESDNTKLTKGVPSLKYRTAVTTNASLPKHVIEIVKFKKSKLHNLELDGHNFALKDDCLYQHSYNLIPYTDINRVEIQIAWHRK